MKYFSLVFLLSYVFLLTFASAADIAYVVKSSANADSYLIQEIENLDYSYDIITQSQVASTNFSNYRLILVGDSNLDNPDSIPVDKHLSLIINSYNYYEKNLDKQLGWSKDTGSLGSPSSLKLANFTSPVTSGVSATFSAYTTTDPNLKAYYLNGNKPSGTSLLVTTANSNFDSVIALVNPGNVFLNGKTAQKRGIYFGITDAQYWTPSSRKLFQNSLNWLLLGEDRDNDGSFSEFDCNDQDSTIKPGAAEIPYDGIDQDCNEWDLVDIDNDGFDGIPAGGDDCNDTNASYKPNSTNPLFDCINDAPNITSFSPNDNVRLLAGKTQVFSISATDKDNTIKTRWLINEVEVANGTNSYLFNKGLGSYTLKVIVSDTIEEDSHSWIVFVGDTNQFTCSEVGGFSCTADQMCPGNSLNVKSSSLGCCAVSCIEKFNGIDFCPALNSSLKVDITKPSSSAKFYLGDKLNATIQITNIPDRKQDLHIEALLYNKDSETVLESYDADLELDKNKQKTISFNMEIPDNLEINEDGDYLLFVKANNLVCNQDYIPIEINRQPEDIQITDFEVQTRVSCGDSVTASVRIENSGSSSEDAYIQIESDDLGINEKTETFEIGAYDEEDNSERKELELYIPDDVESGSYDLTANVVYSGDDVYETTTIIVRDCGEEEDDPVVESKSEATNLDEKISLNAAQEDNVVEEEPSSVLALLAIFSLLLGMISIMYYFFLFTSKNKKRKSRKRRR